MTWQDCLPPCTDLETPDYPGSPCLPEALQPDERPLLGGRVMCLTCGEVDRTRPWWMELNRQKAITQ